MNKNCYSTSPRFDRPFDKLMVLSNVEGLTALSESKGCTPSRGGHSYKDSSGT